MEMNLYILRPNAVAHTLIIFIQNDSLCMTLKASTQIPDRVIHYCFMRQTSRVPFKSLNLSDVGVFVVFLGPQSAESPAVPYKSTH